MPEAVPIGDGDGFGRSLTPIEEVNQRTRFVAVGVLLMDEDRVIGHQRPMLPFCALGVMDQVRTMVPSSIDVNGSEESYCQRSLE